ncbi:MAG: sulfite exporter TauE/SafE family protein, partial [Ilumatobacter sp.]|nr:sulfite exporter TauE/SafE family protein [Ilumatobacter sp.]
MHWVWIVLIGAGVGFLGGMFGKGGSAIATPLLAAAGVPPLIAVASPLPATVPGTLVAYRSYHGSGFSDHRIIRWSLIYGIPATVVGALITRWIGGEFLVKFTDVVVAILGVRIIVQTIRHSQTHAGPETTDT